MKCPSKPWFTKGLAISSDTKNSLFEKAVTTKILHDWNFYKKYLNIFTKTKKMAYYLYYREKAILYGHNKGKVWKLINEISNRKRKKSKSIKCIHDKNGKAIKDPLKIPNYFNHHFAEIYLC